jgi:UTP--glucose-1-phosphate uridylyltransferase
MLKNKGKENAAQDMKNFYKKIENSTIVWVNQPQPKGFGDAILKAQSFVGDEPFLVHAGDTYIISNENKHLKDLIKIFEEFKSDIIFLIKKVEDTRKYGVIEGKEISENIYEIKRVIEKPEKPPTNLAIMPVYIFHPVIFKAIEITSPGVGGEIQLTDAIQKIIDWKLKVYALELKPNEIILDIGSPETYWEALRLSYEHSQGMMK